MCGWVCFMFRRCVKMVFCFIVGVVNGIGWKCFIVKVVVRVWRFLIIWKKVF